MGGQEAVQIHRRLFVKFSGLVFTVRVHPGFNPRIRTHHATCMPRLNFYYYFFNRRLCINCTEY